MIWAVPTVPISAGEANCVRTMSGTSEPRMMKSITSKNNPAVTIAKTHAWIRPMRALSSVVSTYSTIDCANVLPFDFCLAGTAPLRKKEAASVEI